MTTPLRPDRNARRRESTRKRLIGAGRALIAAGGVANLTISRVVEHADLGAGTFYLHFDAKEDLVDAIVAESLDAVAAAAVHDAGSSDPAEVIAGSAARVVRLAFDAPDLAALLVNLEHGHDVFGSAMAPYARPLIAEGLASGRFDPELDVDLTLTALLGATFAVLRECLRGRIEEGGEIEFSRMALVTLGLDRVEARHLAARAAVVG